MRSTIFNLHVRSFVIYLDKQLRGPVLSIISNVHPYDQTELIAIKLSKETKRSNLY